MEFVKSPTKLKKIEKNNKNRKKTIYKQWKKIREIDLDKYKTTT